MENPLLTFHGGKKNNENFPSVGNCADGMLEKSRKGFSENVFFLIKKKKKKTFYSAFGCDTKI
jgi:hypothetical protein